MRLLQRAFDTGEGRGELRAETLHGSDDGYRDARGDQAIFDGRCAGLIA